MLTINDAPRAYAVLREIEQEPQRSKLAEWRKAVAEGKTLFGFPEWCRQVQ